MKSQRYYLSGASRGVVIFGCALLAMYGGLISAAVAGDLLRGGYTMSSQSQSSSPDSITPVSVTQARQSAEDVLARTTQAIQSARSMQAAASKIAVSGANNLGLNPNNTQATLPNVPNGLGIGGLQPMSGATANSSVWSGANLPTQTVLNGRDIVTIKQTSADAVLTWQTFNVGKSTTLDFNQNGTGGAASDAIAFNVVKDPSGVPTQILGQINAPGQVYVINQNGIIFGGASQVNVHTLVASTLPIDTSLITQGILNNPDDQFLFSALAQPSGPNGTPAFTPPASYLASGADGDVMVQQGAQITAPSNGDGTGGRVVLVGPNVTNDGSISTPDGQTILAAGLQVGFTAHPESDATLRGLDVYVGAVTSSSYMSGAADAGTANNAGIISAAAGNVTMAGKVVDQFGDIDSTTTVSVNGRIDLQASYGATSGDGNTQSAAFIPTLTGVVELGAGSVTQILPDWASTETVVLPLELNSTVNIEGLAIYMAANSTIFAPSANVTVNAGQWTTVVADGVTAGKFVNSAGQVYMAPGSIIDVQGSWDVSAPVSQNIVAAQLLGPELEDSPLQRDGVLDGQTVYVDSRDSGVYDEVEWVGTPLANVSGYVDLIQYTIGELTTQGGTVDLNAGGSVVMQKGSQVNVSGGWIDYQGGIVETSEVISGGNILPINEATPNLVYQDINLGTFTVSEAKYGESQTYTIPIIDLYHYEDSYVQGGAGGSLTISAPSTALDGQLTGLTVAGPRQQQVLPDPSEISINYVAQQDNAGGTQYSPTPPNIVFSQTDNLPAPAAFGLDNSGNPLPLSTTLQNNVVLTPNLVGSDGFGKLVLNDGDGNVTVPAGVSLNAGPDGSVTMEGANIDILGSIYAPGGSLSFTAYDVDPYTYSLTLTQTPPNNAKRGHFVLGSGASLSTAGLLVDDRYGIADAYTVPLVLNGGSVAVTALETDMQAGSSINVSGGYSLNSSGTPSYGNGGTISISGGRDPDIASIPGGSLMLDAALTGFSGATGGSLTIKAPAIQIGGASSNPDVLVLSPGFFSGGGFASFSLSGIGESLGNGNYLPGIEIAPGVMLAPVVTSLVADPRGSNLSTVEAILPVGQRPAVNLAFNATGLNDSFSGALDIRGDIYMGAGSVIQTDPLATVTFSGQTAAILGSVYAPGGSISVTDASTSASLFGGSSTTLPTVDLGPQSILSAAGAIILTPNPLGYRTGNVLPGGTITISGNIVAEAGSVLDVSGATDVLDVSPVVAGVAPVTGPSVGSAVGSFGGTLMVPMRIDSNGGTITLNGGQDLFSDAELIGQAGGPSAVGGALVVSSGLGDSNIIPPSDPTLTVTQNQPAIPFASFYPAGQDAIGHAVVDAHGNAIPTTGYFSADTFLAGGFNSLTLEGSVLFKGPVDIAATGSLVIATGGVIEADSKVILQAPFVELGTPFLPPTAPSQLPSPFSFGSSAYTFQPAYGSGDLTVIASLIDIGNLSLQGIGNAKFIANGGDIQGDGTLDVAGNIYMQAGQIYPPTETTFTIAAYNYTNSSGNAEQGTVTFVGSGDMETPLSAGGVLNVYASVINQDGVLRAPIGQINLGWNGAGTAPIDPITGAAVDATTTVTLGRGSITSVSGIDSLTGQPMLIPYGINSNGTSWIDPEGNDITTGGVPQKTINISGANIVDNAGAVIDIRGGGNLVSYQFVSGVGGDTDILASTSSYAIIPGYQAAYAPYAPYNPNPLNDTLGGDPGYVNGTLAVGEEVYLTAQGSLPAGYYTLLPARYALLPGAYLVTPGSGTPEVNQTLPDGSYVVSGYETNSFASAETAAPGFSTFDVQSSAVVANEAQYTLTSANYFLAQQAVLNGVSVPRLPRDSGQVEFNAVQSLAIQGVLESQSIAGGLGGLVDISSPTNIVITGAGAAQQAGELNLDAGELTSFGAASLLIGGSRNLTGNDATITVTTGNITVDNGSEALAGQDIILAANDSVTVDSGAVIGSSGAGGNAESITVDGNGALLRVSSDENAATVRSGNTTATGPELTVDANAKITGESVTLDSSAGMSLDPDAALTAKSVALDAGQITVELDNPGAVAANSGLVLSGKALSGLFANAVSVSLLSYGSLDIYGTGTVGVVSSTGVDQLQNLALRAAEIRGFNNGGGAVVFNAQNVLLDNSPDGTGPGAVAASAGTLQFNANTIELGSNEMNIDQFVTVNLNATGGIMGVGQGTLAASGALNVTAPLITGAQGAQSNFTSGGMLTLSAPAKATTPTVSGGLAATLTFIGGAGVTDDADITLPAGNLTLEATAGDVVIGENGAATLNVAGVAKPIYDVTEYTNGGQINLVADTGNVTLGKATVLTVAAESGGGNAGTLSISAPNGTVMLAGQISGAGGLGGNAGSFVLNLGSLPDMQSLNDALTAADFAYSQSIEVQTGDVLVDGVATAANFSLTADGGSITVTGEINGSGQTGGTVELQAEGSVTLESGGEITVAAQNYDAAGKGGAVSLEAGSDVNGVASSGAEVDIQAGSTIDLSVANTSPALGDLAGTLHIRAPQTASNTDLQVDAIDGTIVGASSITVEGYEIFNTASDNGSIDDQETNVFNNATTFAGNTAAISARLLANNSGLASVLTIEPGAEIINPDGDLTLGNNWDLSTFRFGPDNVAGDLTLRAAGNVIFDFAASLSDGFAGATYTAKLLPVGSTSWSYRITAGANFNSASYSAVQSLASLPAGEGSVLLGEGAPALPTSGVTSRSQVLPDWFQTIRTGVGDIDISAGRDVQLLNSLATIYTAGTQAPAMANFNVPVTTYGSTVLGAEQSPLYAAQYSYEGGNVSISAQDDIEHLVLDENTGELVPDSSLEMPTSWLYRRGYIDPATGQFGTSHTGYGIDSTTWWIDFSNFYEGVGAMGGGNVSLTAGNDIVNVDAVVPTNARLSEDGSVFQELGGGNLAVTAGDDINAGVYYVERGQGVLTAGNSIVTNYTRAPLLTSQVPPGGLVSTSPDDWLPTTLFLGVGDFDVSAGDNVLLGSVVNPFLLPQGINNSYFNKTYFSTYASTDQVDVFSLTGSVTLKDSSNDDSGSLQEWYENIFSIEDPSSIASVSEPWLRIDETDPSTFSALFTLMPPTLRATAFSGDIDIVGNTTLSPAPDGTLDLLAAGSINGLQPNGAAIIGGIQQWDTSVVNISDANPASIPGVLDPLGDPDAFTDLTTQSLDALFGESGSTEGAYGVIGTQEALHAPGLLHAKDTVPVHVYSAAGNISGFTLFSPKLTRIIAGANITDISFYLQNDNADDVSIVSAGQDIIAYDQASLLRQEAQLPGNTLGNFSLSETVPGSGTPNAGDIQIAGSGALEVLAGRDLTLGVGPNNPDGTAVGITSIGNAANPFLPFDGAQLIVAAGLGGVADGLEDSSLKFETFDNTVLGGADGAAWFADLTQTEPQLDVSSYTEFKKLSKQQQAIVGLDLFYLVLRDAGRDHNLVGNPGYGNYAAGLAAIQALIPSSSRSGDINLTSKEIKTENGGDLDILAPNGQLTVGVELAGATPTNQGVLTEDGGNISIYTEGDVDVGTSRIFTLKGGNIIIWSNSGNIAAGESSKTVLAAPPTEVIIDPQNGNVETDLAGLATGGGIGVLASIPGIVPGDVDLIAPLGVINAGDAGIRASGNLNLAAVQVLNASNIVAGGASAGVPTVTVAAPNLAAFSAASASAGASTAAANEQAQSQDTQTPQETESESIINVQVLGYGGGDDSGSGG